MKSGRLLKFFHKPNPEEGKKNTKKVVVFTAFTIFNLFAVSAASFAWFTMSTKKTKVSTVSGDLNVSIKKVVAYKYVFPFYENTTEFIDYYETNEHGKVKSYVIDDASITETISTNVATFTLGSATNGVASSSAAASATNVYKDNTQVFRYFLVGDSTFNGVPNKDWCTSVAVALGPTNSVSTDVVEIHNVMVAAGAKLILFDQDSKNGSNHDYLTYGNVEQSGAPFKASNDGTYIQCLKAGIYSFRYFRTHDDTTDTDVDKLTITGTPRADDSIIGNNIMDPTKISVDFTGKEGIDEEEFDTLEKYIPEGIKKQNTTVILDVTLEYRNVNAVEAQLKVIRNSTAFSSVYSLSGKYNNNSAFFTGYSASGNGDPAMLASDFYAYYAVLCPSSSAYATNEAVWEAMHKRTDLKDASNQPMFSRFENDGSVFETSIACKLHAKSGNNDDLIIPGTTTNVSSEYHCYIAIDYDYEHCKFFFHNNRLSRTYLLDRDMGFRFVGKQKLES